MACEIQESPGRKIQPLGEEEWQGIVSLYWNEPTILQRMAAKYQEAGCHKGAIAALQRVVELIPRRADLLNELGRALEAFGETHAASDVYRRGIDVEPDSDVMWANLGNALLHTDGELENAEYACRRAAKLNPSSPHVRNALGCVLLEKGELAEACECLRVAVRRWPDFAGAHSNLGLALLTLGDLKQGFAEREWRRKFEPVHRRTGAAWAGEDVFGHTVLLYGEGGLGNAIQFARYVPMLAKRGARIVLECHAKLAPLLRQLPGVWKTSTFGEDVRGWDMYCPLASIPAVWGTTLDNVPAGVPYLTADADRFARWEARLRPIKGYRVGIAWRAEQRTRYGRQRSIPLEYYAHLATVQGVSLISLDTEWDGSVNFPLVRLDGLDQDAPFLDTAAVMKHLDLVVTCDTSIGHLAGALGTPVWIAERSVPDWRWMTEREDSPWYPTVRLVRQRITGDWAGVFRRMAEELKRRVA